MPPKSKFTSNESVKEAQRNAKDKALTSRVVANGARKAIKQVVDWLECHPSHAGPCLLGLRDGLFDMGESDGASKETDNFSVSADYIRLLPVSVIKPALMELGGLTEEIITRANKYDKKAYIKMFCFMFGEVQGQPIPSNNKNIFMEIYAKLSEVIGKKTPVFTDLGAVDWSKGAFYLKTSDVAHPNVEGETLKVQDLYHVSGVKVLYRESSITPGWTLQNNWSDEQATLVSTSGHTKVPLIDLLPAEEKAKFKAKNALKEQIIRDRESQDSSSNAQSSCGSSAGSQKGEGTLPLGATPLAKKQRVRA